MIGYAENTPGQVGMIPSDTKWPAVTTPKWIVFQPKMCYFSYTTAMGQIL